MKKLISIVVLCSMCKVAVAGNKGIFEKGYMLPIEYEYTLSADEISFLTIDSSFLPSGDIIFHLKDTKGNEVQISMSEFYKVFRSVNPDLSDRIYRKAREFKEDTCPLCGSENVIGDPTKGQNISWYQDSKIIAEMYGCADCGSVYAVKDKEAE